MPLYAKRCVLSLSVMMLAAPLSSLPKNAVVLDFNPELAAMFFNVSGVDGFGFELGYDRVLTERIGVGGRVKYLYLAYPAYDAEWSTLHITVHGRYYMFLRPEKLFFDTSLGGLWHRSPYQNSFMLSLGSAVGWKLLIKGHFVVEPYAGWAVFSGDKFLVPWTMTALSELLIPGFYMGVSLGWAF